MEATHTPIGAFLYSRKERPNPSVSTVETFTVLRQPAGEPYALHTVKGVIFGFKTYQGSYTTEVAIHIGDSTGVMSIDLSRYQNREVLEALVAINAEVGTCVEVVGKVVAHANLFPVFQANEVVSLTQPTVRELRNIASALAMRSYSAMCKPQLICGIINAQKDLYCRIRFVSGHGNNHKQCRHT